MEGEAGGGGEVSQVWNADVLLTEREGREGKDVSCIVGDTVMSN